MSVTHVARLARGSQEFESNREEIKNKNSEEYNVLRFTLEGLIEELERHFDSAHANYMATTEQRTQDFKNLTIKDQTSARTIETQMRRLQRLQDSMCHWKTKLTSNAKKCEERCVIQDYEAFFRLASDETTIFAVAQAPWRLEKIQKRIILGLYW